MVGCRCWKTRPSKDAPKSSTYDGQKTEGLNALPIVEQVGWSKYTPGSLHSNEKDELLRLLRAT